MYVHMRINYLSFGQIENPLIKPFPFLLKCQLVVGFPSVAFIPEVTGQLHIFVLDFVLL